MSENENPEVKKTKSGGVLGTLIGFGAGALVGAVTALLFAPQSGDESREKIKERLGEVSEKASDALDRSREAIDEAKNKMSSAYEDAVEKTTAVIEQAKGKIAGKKDEDEDEDDA